MYRDQQMSLVLISTYIDNHNIKNKNASGNLGFQVLIGSASIVSIM
jgi:hypothetical protein